MNKTFKKAYIEITNVCNLSCDFCPKTKRKPEFMSIELFQKIIHEIKPYTNYVYLHVMGEPMLHKNISEFIDICDKNNIKVNITTNGTLIKTVGQKINSTEALRLINFSLHSFEGNTNTNNINMDEYLKDIFEYIKTNTKINICLRLWNLGNESIEKNDYILNKIKNEFELDFNIEEKIIEGNGIKLKDNVYLHQAERFKWPNINNKPYLDKGFCYGLRTQFGILVDGTVIPCCLDSEGIINLGNIKINSFKEIIESYRAKKIYDDFSKRYPSEDLCKTCGYMQSIRNKKNKKV